MSDALIEDAEALLNKHEQAALDKHAHTGVDVKPPEGCNMSDAEALAEVAKLLDAPGMAELSGMAVIIWRLYAVIRQEMETALGEKMRPEVFAALIQGLHNTAMQPFSVVDLHRDTKKKLLLWIRDISDERAAKNRKGIHGNGESTAETDA